MQGLNLSVIPNMIDITAFSPTDKQAARKQFSFPLEKKIVLMGAAKLNDPIKGFRYLKDALSLLKEDMKDIYLVLFGKIKDAPSFLPDIPVEYTFMNLLSDTSIISQLYNAADVTVVPSYYETFGQTLIESMACGCPVVSFNNSGQTDIIDHKVNGYLAEYKNTKDLANGILWVLTEANYAELSRNAIDKVRQTYDESIIAGKYKDLYEEIVSKQASH
ncbi:hypothetical protein FACS1894181_07360 [Bacteroidia bacterium]|nr:hypothetical protein FACS1894181_07360 [Bacteroidia bacterium]